MSKKGQLQISFGWLFAIIAGIFILALAVYFSVKFIGLGQQTTGAESISEISVLLNPLETSFEASKTSSLTLPKKTIIKNFCDEKDGAFGSQNLGLAQKSFGEFKRVSTERRSENRYLFSNETVQGKKFYLFSKDFKMPFSVASLIYITSSNEKYCFADIPPKLEDVKEELESLNQSNIEISNSLSGCGELAVKICFDSVSEGCNINVDTFDKSVVKENGEKTYYETDALMYAAIFSNKEIYECQVFRLMQRLNSLALIYDEKASMLESKGCSVGANPLALANSASSLDTSEDLIFLRDTAKSVDEQNSVARCALW